MSIYIVVLIGLILAQLCNFTFQACPHLEMFIEDRQELNFTCDSYGRNSTCEDGWNSFSANLSSGQSVGKPRDIKVEMFRRSLSSGNEIEYSGMTVQWKVPIEGLSREHTKGYFLRMFKAGSARIFCRLFDLRRVKLSSPHISFSYEYYPFNISTRGTYVLELISLPPPSQQEFEEGLYGKYFVSVPEKKDISEGSASPGDWTTWVQLQLKAAAGQVTVTFGFPEEESQATFTKFKVQLVRVRPGPIRLQGEKQGERIGQESFGSVTFHNVSIGTYIVKITPIDRRQNDPNCECWKMNKFYNFRICGCSITRTNPFNFTVAEPQTSTSGEPQTSASGEPQKSTSAEQQKSTSAEPQSSRSVEPVKQSTSEDGNQHITTIILAVTLSLAAVGGVALSVFCLIRHRLRLIINKKDAQCNKNTNCTVHAAATDIYSTTQHTDRGWTETVVPMPTLERKVVILLASDDHEYFSQAVHMFACFLELHCQCQVLLAPKQLSDLHKAANSYCWLSRQIDTAHFVLIITSKAAFHLYSAFRDGQAYRQADFGPTGDLFTPGIQHICGKIACNESMHKVMIVRFDHTSPKWRLPISALSSCLYHLPNHLAPLLQVIHGLDPETMDLHKANLPLQGNVEELRGGKEWLAAIEESANYERLSSDWFDIRFGQPVDIMSTGQGKPNFSKQESADSGYSGQMNSNPLQRRLSSVSTHFGHTDPWPASGPLEKSVYVNRGYEYVVINDDFIAPSEMLSAFTIRQSDCTSVDRPTHVDQDSVFTTPFVRNDDFIAPSEMLSTYTVRQSDFTTSDRPSQMDQDSGFTTQIQQLNNCYEYEQRRRRETRVQNAKKEEEGSITEQKELGHLHLSQSDIQLDCLSLSSAESV